MKKLVLVFVIPWIVLSTNCQISSKNVSLNFDFETTTKGTAVGWTNFGSTDYKISLDSIYVQNGKYSAVIEYTVGESDFKAWTFSIPDNYEGKKITLSGYIKTENVTDGYAGLWMRIDPSIAFDNMSNNGIVGTTDWTRYEITLDMDPKKTKQIVLGGLLVGKGKMWLDNLKVSIDGKDISNLKPIDKIEYAADKDKEFDNGSGISLTSFDKNLAENLKTLGMVWGFLKYYHPNIAKGDYNWDYELFRILPKVLQAENKQNLDEILTKWVEGLGKFSINKEVFIDTAKVKILPDLDWIRKSDFSTKLSNLLQEVKDAERLGEHYYIGLNPSVGNPEFKNEHSYTSMKYPDIGFRLLALYRYWNIIEYYFPYKNLIEEDWKMVLEEFLPKFVHAKDETEYSLAMLELIGRVHDTHANIWGQNAVLNNYLGHRYAILDITFIENKPVVTGYFDEDLGKKTGLLVGDVISSINDVPMETVLKDKLKYSPASNYPTKLRDIGTNLLRTNESTIHVEFLRNNVKQSKTLNTYHSSDINVFKKYMYNGPAFKMITNEIAYINNGAMKKDSIAEAWKEFEHSKGLIIDIRNYPSDFIIYDLSDYLLPKSMPFVKLSNGNLDHPGKFTFIRTLNAGKENASYYKGKVILIINELTQSSAEFHTMAYQLSPNVTIIGSTTAAADGNVSQFNLPGGISTMISGIGVYYPDERETQRIGIVPDIEIKPTIKGIIEGRDELLVKAIQLINESR
jgi:C-terminal processing protease CtpA/Prc